MATLPTEDRQRIWRGLMRYWSSLKEVQAWSKADLQAAVNATDAWIDANQSSYNSALPEPFKSNATLAQKTILFCAVAAMRVSEAWLRAIIGEVD